METFSARVKNELCRSHVQRQCCARAEMYGILLYCNTFNTTEVRIITESLDFANRLPKLLQRAFSLHFDRLPDEDNKGKYVFQITDAQKMGKILNTYGYETKQNPVMHLNYAVLEEECCRMSFVRGAFLAGGSVTDPEKSYHLEMSSPHLQASREACSLLNELGFEPRSVKRGNSAVLYFKQHEAIEDFLTGLGAPVAAMDIMTAKVDKEISNRANRAMNCDMANVNKMLDAAKEQMDAITHLTETGRMDVIPAKLRETAEMRVRYPDLSLQQLAEKFDPPLSKSCLNHRIRKIMELAKQ